MPLAMRGIPLTWRVAGASVAREGDECKWLKSLTSRSFQYLSLALLYLFRRIGDGDALCFTDRSPQLMRRDGPGSVS